MKDAPHFRIGTRGSDLALWQAHHVRDLITAAGGTADITVLSTQGDREQVQAFEKLEGKGFFTKEIEQALIEDRIDLAVHSHKDLETRQPPGLCIAAVPPRASAHDVLLVHPRACGAGPWLDIAPGARVGTSSVRRRDQLLLLRPDLRIEALRGNVPTRLGKLTDGTYDAIVLAAAGLERLDLDLSGAHVQRLDPRWFVPAPAQGALALQMREGDPRVSWLGQLTDAAAASAIEEERTVLRALDGGCQLPFGAHRAAGKAPLRCFLQKESGPTYTVSTSSALALDALDDDRPRRVLITRVPRPGDLLHRLAQGHGHTLVEWPCAIPEALEGTEAPTVDADWIWVGSPGAARMAESWLDGHPATRIAVPGNGTADALREVDRHRLGFCGTGHPVDAWSAFAAARKAGEHIAIPHGRMSLRRWEGTTTRATLHPWVQYDVVANPEPVPQADVVCFTSPSNVHLWKGDAPAVCMAIGATTSAALHQKGWKHVVAHHPDAFGIMEALQQA